MLVFLQGCSALLQGLDLSGNPFVLLLGCKMLVGFGIMFGCLFLVAKQAVDVTCRLMGYRCKVV
jgi:hypothetical protein